MPTAQLKKTTNIYTGLFEEERDCGLITETTLFSLLAHIWHIA